MVLGNGDDRWFETASHTDIGARQEQQDRVAVFEKEGALLLAVADGLGGLTGGALAAETVMEVAESCFGPSDAGSDPAALFRSIVSGARRRCHQLGAERMLDPHTTCVLLRLTAAGAHWAHVGDSRLYRFEDGRIAERTLDHSRVEELRLLGRITEGEMRTHPERNLMNRAIGSWDPPEISEGSAPAAAGGAFLLATDGLWENAAPAELEEAIAAEDLSAGLRKLVAGARRKGGATCDNITVAAARRSGSPPPRNPTPA